MLAWSFSARTLDEVAALLRAMGRHRYVRETSHALHWSVDEALSDLPPFAARAAAFRARRDREPGLDVTSRDPSLWAYADTEVVIEALGVFWTKGERAVKATERLREILEESELGVATHAPFEADPEEPPHPELILLDWEFFPIDELDPERHEGALRALELAGEEVHVSAPVYQESACLAYPELAEGAPQGVLPTDFLIWSDGAYSYVDYVFRGVAKAARLVDPPVGIRDLDE
jgi:hypothetical protein